MTLLAPTLQAFFTDRLIRERAVSPNTIAAYRDTMRLLLGFASDQLRKELSRIDIGDLDAELIGEFLEHLERDRGCGAQTRNCRLTAIRSLLRYAARRHPEHALVIERVLAIPPKRRQRTLITFLTEPRDAAPAHRRARPLLLDRPPRPSDAGARDPDRTARLRADRPHDRGREARRRCARQLRWQRTRTSGSRR